MKCSSLGRVGPPSDLGYMFAICCRVEPRPILDTNAYSGGLKLNLHLGVCRRLPAVPLLLASSTQPYIKSVLIDCARLRAGIV
jgi:hypothetical protein